MDDFSSSSSPESHACIIVYLYVLLLYGYPFLHTIIFKKSNKAKHACQLFPYTLTLVCAPPPIKRRILTHLVCETWVMNGRGGLGAPPWTVHQLPHRPFINLPAPKLKNCQLIQTSITAQSPRLTDLIASITFTLTEASLVREGYSICAVTPWPAPFSDQGHKERICSKVP